MAPLTVLVQLPEGARLSMALAEGREVEQIQKLAEVVPPSGTWWVEQIATKDLLAREAEA